MCCGISLSKAKIKIRPMPSGNLPHFIYNIAQFGQLKVVFKYKKVNTNIISF